MTAVGMTEDGAPGSTPPDKLAEAILDGSLKMTPPRSHLLLVEDVAERLYMKIISHFMYCKDPRNFDYHGRRDRHPEFCAQEDKLESIHRTLLKHFEGAKAAFPLVWTKIETEREADRLRAEIEGLKVEAAERAEDAPSSHAREELDTDPLPYYRTGGRGGRYNGEIEQFRRERDQIASSIFDHRAPGTARGMD